MSETQITNTTNSAKRNSKTLNSQRCKNYYRKHNPELPRSPINGKKYNPKFKWVALAVQSRIGETIIFSELNAADGFKRALKRLGFEVVTKRSNQGYHVTNAGFLRRVK